MPSPPPLTIDHAHSLSQRYFLEPSPSQGDVISPPPEPRPFLPFSPSDSDNNLVSSGSEDFKDRDRSPPQGGLPSFYQTGSHSRVNTTGDPPATGVSKQKSVDVEDGWTRHFAGWRVIMLDSYLNMLLLLIPAAWTIRLVMEEQFALVFSFCILALIPLVRLHDITIAQLALRIGGSKTALLNASMSNFVEIVLAISALRKCELRVVQSSLVGAILSKLLLILGLCFFAGGLRFSEQGFNPTATQVHSSLLSISVAVLLLPAAYHFTLSGGAQNPDVQKAAILKMSHSVSIILILIYLAYLAFQLWSHTHLYQDDHNKTSERLPATQNISAEKAAAYLSARSRSTLQSCRSLADFDKLSIRGLRSPPLSVRSRTRPKTGLTPPKRPYATDVFPGSAHGDSSSAIGEDGSWSDGYRSSDSVRMRPIAGPTIAANDPSIRLVGGLSQASGVNPPGYPQYTIGEQCSSPLSSSITDFGDAGKEPGGLAAPGMGLSESSSGELRATPKKVKPKKEPQLSWFLTVSVMLIVTVAVAITADWLVESMDGISSTISKEWVALILLPAVSSVAECITAVRVSVRDELTLSVSVAAGSTIQTTLFVIPFIVILGWATNKPLTLLMDPFESLVLYLSVQTTGYVLADGKSNWLEGFILISLYLIIAVSFWFYPGSTPLDFLAVCPH